MEIKSELLFRARAIDVRQEVATGALDTQFYVLQLYNALTDAKLITAYTRAPAEVDAQPNGKFSLFDKSIVGHFTEAVG